MFALGPPRPKVRILEIGAGTGATTAAILNMLQPFSGCVEFCFSDISPAFIRNAKRRFEERYPWVEYRLLNIEEDISRQGFERHGFDLIVAANVLHDTRDIEVSLQQARRLLKPGGLLVLDEYTSVKDCLFFSGALLHGYWLFQDPERRLKTVVCSAYRNGPGRLRARASTLLDRTFYLRKVSTPPAARA